MSGGEVGLGDRVKAVGLEVFQHLHFAERPADGELLDRGIVTEAEVDDRERARGRLDVEFGADAVAVGHMAGELEFNAVAGGGVVAEDRRRAVLVRNDDVEVSVVNEIDEGAAEGNAQVVEPPGCGYFGELQVAEVVIGEGVLTALGGILPDRGPGGKGGGDVLFVDGVRIDEIADHPGREEHVLAAVVVEVGDARAPSPSGGVHAGQVRRFLVVVGACAEIDGAPDVLGNQFGYAFHLPEAAADLLHAGHIALAGVVAHVSDDEIDHAVVVQIAGIGAH